MMDPSGTTPGKIRMLSEEIRYALCFSLFAVSLCSCSSSNDNFVKLGEPRNSFDRNSTFQIPKDEAYSKWNERHADPLENTYIGEGKNPNGVETQFPFGRTGWGTRQYENSF
jgi:hypothetical protein